MSRMGPPPGSGERSLDWRLAAERAGNAILKANPHWLIFVEGVEKLNRAITGGVATFQTPVRHQFVSIFPASSFTRDMTIPLLSITNLGSSTRVILEISRLSGIDIGAIARQNIAPVFLGEFGSKLVTPSDGLWLSELVRFLNSNGGSGSETNRLGMSWQWRSWNPDSFDTGGILNESWKRI